MSSFDYLTGTVRINAPAPEDWFNSRILPFWQNPNDPRWGQQVCRHLYHETIHFWQLLSSWYLSHLVALEWERLVHYEQTGEINPPHPVTQEHDTKRFAFSAAELVECWARYWDVHTRGAHTIIAEEQIPHTAAGLPWGYSGEEYDLVMQAGKHSQLYAAPYRWLLQMQRDSFRENGIPVAGASFFTALIFPYITYAAFCSQDPVLAFSLCSSHATNPNIVRQIAEIRTGSAANNPINLDWFIFFDLIRNEVIDPVVKYLTQNNVHISTDLRESGFSVIYNGSLRFHPSYGEYPDKVNERVWLSPPFPQASDIEKLVMNICANFREKEPFIMFNLPGQPAYRLLLGRLVPPPALQFNNGVWYAERSEKYLLHEAVGSGGGRNETTTFETIHVDLEKRVNRFRAAQKAVELGLPPNAFE
jgi:hypothetical protein